MRVVSRWKWGVRLRDWFDDNYFDPQEVPYSDRPLLDLSSNAESVKEVLPSHSIEIYKLYREKIIHEDTLVNWRTTWFVTLQAFLFTAFAISQGKSESLGWLVNIAFSLTGISIAVASFISIVAAKEAVNKTIRKWRTEYHDASAGRHLSRGVRDLIDPAGVLPALKGAGSNSSIGLRGNVFSFFVPFFIGCFWSVVFIVSLASIVF